VVDEIACPNDAESCASDSITTGLSNLTGQVEAERPSDVCPRWL